MKTFEDTEGINRIRKSKKDRQHNGQKRKDKREKSEDTIGVIIKTHQSKKDKQ
jgi:hypothetical protein